jgi:hypothetical protein
MYMIKYNISLKRLSAFFLHPPEYRTFCTKCATVAEAAH